MHVSVAIKYQAHRIYNERSSYISNKCIRDHHMICQALRGKKSVIKRKVRNQAEIIRVSLGADTECHFGEMYR